MGPFDLVAVDYMTFVPDFAPRWSLPWLRPVEKALESGRGRSYSVHYAAVLKKRSADSSLQRGGTAANPSSRSTSSTAWRLGSPRTAACSKA